MLIDQCLFLQTTPNQNQVEGTLQSELLPVHTASPQTPPTENIAQPPSTVDTAALNEEPLPGERIMGCEIHINTIDFSAVIGN